MRSSDRLRALHSDVCFSAARDQRGRERFTTRRDEMQRLSNAARRGYDVPPELEEAWGVLKRKRSFSNQEIADMLNLKPWWVSPHGDMAGKLLSKRRKLAVGIREIARVLKKSASTTSRLLSAGALPAEKIADRWVADRGELRATQHARPVKAT